MNNPNILKSWTYIYSDLKSPSYTIWENEKVLILDFWSNDSGLNIDLLDNSILEYYSIRDSTSKTTIRINSVWNKSKTSLNILNLSKKSIIELEINSLIESQGCNSEINIISLCGDEWKVKLNSWITITKNWINSTGNILQENIFLWETWKITWIPALNIKTSESKANHALKIEKIKEEDLFYLESRWIDKTTATNIMLRSKINNLFKNLPDNHLSFYENKLEDFLLR